MSRCTVCVASISIIATVASIAGVWADPLTSDELDELGLGRESAIDEAPVVSDSSAPSGATAAITVILQEGDLPPGAPGAVASLNQPFTNGNAQVGFLGVAGTDRFIWFDTGISFLSGSVTTHTLTGGEGVIGIGDNGEFVYSPAIDGDDGVWTDLGLLAREGEQAAGFATGVTSTFHSRPTMDDSGRAYWVAGFDPSGGDSTQGRVLYTSPDRTPGSITPMLKSGDQVGGFTLSSGSSGLDFDYQFSGDGDHHIHVLVMDTGSTNDDGFVYVDGVLVARESEPTGGGDNWDSFDTLTINASGQYLFSGDTDGDTGSDEFIALGTSPAVPSIVVREGDTIGGLLLESAASVRSVTMSDTGFVLHAWSVSSGAEYVFLGHVSDLAGTSELILATGDPVDVDGDGSPDATFTDLNTFGPSFHLNEANIVFLEVDLDYGSGDLEAIIEYRYPAMFSDGFESGATDVWSSASP